MDALVEAVEDYEEDVPDKEEVPIKCVSTVMNYQINCGIQENTNKESAEQYP